MAERVAATDSTVLILGESGTGKDLLAQEIHARSPRAAKTFVAVNCAALPETLIESELFGYERGAFTGAAQQKKGKFELGARAERCFLDEIGDMNPVTQAKVLRALENRTIERLGGTQTIPVDVRVISATHRNLPVEIRAGKFREDLFYRLRVVTIELPPLRAHKEDIRGAGGIFRADARSASGADGAAGARGAGGDRALRLARKCARTEECAGAQPCTLPRRRDRCDGFAGRSGARRNSGAKTVRPSDTRTASARRIFAKPSASLK